MDQCPHNVGTDKDAKGWKLRQRNIIASLQPQELAFIRVWEPGTGGYEEDCGWRCDCETWELCHLRIQDAAEGAQLSGPKGYNHKSSGTEWTHLPWHKKEERWKGKEKIGNLDGTHDFENMLPRRKARLGQRICNLEREPWQGWLSPLGGHTWRELSAPLRARPNRKPATSPGTKGREMWYDVQNVREVSASKRPELKQILIYESRTNGVTKYHQSKMRCGVGALKHKTCK